MKILGLIVARGGSRGVPGKNIKKLGGRPLLNYTIESALAANFLTEVALSSDDDMIIETAKKLGISVPFKRPSNLAEDDTSSLAVIQHALRFYIDKGKNFDAVCLLQPTTPFRADGLIDQAITKFKSSNFDSLISVREIPSEYNPHWAFEKKDGILKIATGEQQPISRRQELPPAYYRDGAIYLTKTEIILKKNSLLGEKIGFIETLGNEHINIDTPQDWKRAENILKDNK